jgi:hypothetical protein
VANRTTVDVSNALLLEIERAQGLTRYPEVRCRLVAGSADQASPLRSVWFDVRSVDFVGHDVGELVAHDLNE